MVAIVIASLLTTTAYFTYQTQTLKTQIAEVMAQSQNHLTHLVAQKQLKRISDLNYKIDNLESKILKESEVKNGQLFLVLDPQKFDDQNLIVFRTSDDANHFDCYTNVDKVSVSGCSELVQDDNAIENRDEYIDKLKQLLRDKHISQFLLVVHKGNSFEGRVVVGSDVMPDGFSETMIGNSSANLDVLGIDRDTLEYPEYWDIFEEYRLKWFDERDESDLYMYWEHHINSGIERINNDNFQGLLEINGDRILEFSGGELSGEEFRNFLRERVEEIYSSVY